MEKTEVACPVCNVLEETCEKLGDKEFCVRLIDDLKKDKITEQELVEKVKEHFNPNKFKEAWNKNVENGR